MKKGGIYTGPERRIRPINDRRCDLNCPEHSGLVEKVANIERKTNTIEKADYLQTSTYWLSTGILVTILIAVLSASLYATFQAGEALRKVQDAQMTLIIKMDFLQYDIEQLKKKVP